jgi:hypothetical protein
VGQAKHGGRFLYGITHPWENCRRLLANRCFNAIPFVRRVFVRRYLRRIANNFASLLIHKRFRTMGFFAAVSTVIILTPLRLTGTALVTVQVSPINGGNFCVISAVAPLLASQKQKLEAAMAKVT